MKKFFTSLIVVGILAFGTLVAFVLWKTKPEAAKSEIVVSLPVVEVLPVDLKPLSVQVPSQGIVESARRSVIASELAGKVISVSDKFDVGGIFAKDEVILKIDDSNYVAALAQSKAVLAESLAALAS